MFGIKSVYHVFKSKQQFRTSNKVKLRLNYNINPLRNQYKPLKKLTITSNQKPLFQSSYNFQTIMKSQRKQVQSMLKQLYTMHEQLFGSKYTTGTQINEESEFNKIVEEFRELIFQVRHTQQEREEREKKKNFHQSSQAIQLNYLIREDIQRAQGILAQAANRLQVQKKKAKKQNKDKSKQKKDRSKQQPSEPTTKSTSLQMIKKKQTIIENCYELLKDVKEIQQGGVYQPPQTYQTLNHIKRQLIGKEYQEVEDESINMDEEEFYQKANKNDQLMDDQLDLIIEGNQRVMGKMKNANQAMNEVQEKVIKATTKTEALTQRVRKDEKDLLELLKTYRRPNQLCLDITLVLMVLALIGVIINLVRTL